MDKGNIWRNVTGKLAGGNSSEENADFEKWLKAEKLNHGVFQRLKEIWDYNPRYVQDTPRIWQKFKNRAVHFEHISSKHRFISYALRLSAILFLLVGTTVMLRKYIQPGSENLVSCNEIYVPNGNRTFIVLPDSSKVWISNNSRLKYPQKFSGETRELFLTGEAYFEVTHNAKKPFVVNIGENRIRVLGTKFSVSAHPEDNVINADLISGKIQMDIQTGEKPGNVQSFTVTPGHRMEYNKKTKTIADSNIPEDFYDYWKNGIYSFKNESLESLASKVNRIYNVEIIFADEQLKHKHYNGSFSVNDNIYNFMEAILQTSVEPIEYRKEGNKLYIKLKK
jgi:transmembrane sensor